MARASTTGRAVVVVGIGWTGGWAAKLPWDPNAKTVHFIAGLQGTHLLLHAGESIRTPRIVTLSWTGDRKEAPAQWHRLMLRHYGPQAAVGHDISLPILFAGGGGGKSDDRVAQIGALQTAKIQLRPLRAGELGQGARLVDARSHPVPERPQAGDRRGEGGRHGRNA